MLTCLTLTSVFVSFVSYLQLDDDAELEKLVTEVSMLSAAFAAESGIPDLFSHRYMQNIPNMKPTVKMHMMACISHIISRSAGMLAGSGHDMDWTGSTTRSRDMKSVEWPVA